MNKPLVVPENLQRNAPDVTAVGPEETGSWLIELALERLGLKDLSESDVLDIGCGVRFTQTIINREIPIKSYTGVDVDSQVIEFLQNDVDDRRFSFARWEVRNDLYNPSGPPLTAQDALPIKGTFDVIWMFSVVTHMTPDDTAAMLSIARRYIRPEGLLLFSAFLDHDTEEFQDGDPERPLLRALYNQGYLRRLVHKNGWYVTSVHTAGQFIREHLVCRPNGTLRKSA